MGAAQFGQLPSMSPVAFAFVWLPRARMNGRTSRSPSTAARLAPARADERPEFRELRLLFRATDRLACFGRHPVVLRRCADAHRDHVEHRAAFHLGGRAFEDAEIFHHRPVSERVLLLELQAEPLVDSVGNKRTHRGERLLTPRALELCEAILHAHRKCGGVERAVILPELPQPGVHEVDVRGEGAARDHRILIHRLRLADGPPDDENHDPEKQEHQEPVGIAAPAASMRRTA
jgi:hypothetical protein